MNSTLSVSKPLALDEGSRSSPALAQEPGSPCRTSFLAQQRAGPLPAQSFDAAGQHQQRRFRLRSISEARQKRRQTLYEERPDF